MNTDNIDNLPLPVYQITPTKYEESILNKKKNTVFIKHPDQIGQLGQELYINKSTDNSYQWFLLPFDNSYSITENITQSMNTGFKFEFDPSYPGLGLQKFYLEHATFISANDLIKKIKNFQTSHTNITPQLIENSGNLYNQFINEMSHNTLNPIDVSDSGWYLLNFNTRLSINQNIKNLKKNYSNTVSSDISCAMDTTTAPVLWIENFIYKNKNINNCINLDISNNYINYINNLYINSFEINNLFKNINSPWILLPISDNTNDEEDRDVNKKIYKLITKFFENKYVPNRIICWIKLKTSYNSEPAPSKNSFIYNFKNHWPSNYWKFLHLDPSLCQSSGPDASYNLIDISLNNTYNRLFKLEIYSNLPKYFVAWVKLKIKSADISYGAISKFNIFGTDICNVVICDEVTKNVSVYPAKLPPNTAISFNNGGDFASIIENYINTNNGTQVYYQFNPYCYLYPFSFYSPAFSPINQYYISTDGSYIPNSQIPDRNLYPALNFSEQFLNMLTKNSLSTDYNVKFVCVNNIHSILLNTIFKNISNDNFTILYDYDGGSFYYSFKNNSKKICLKQLFDISFDDEGIELEYIYLNTISNKTDYQSFFQKASLLAINTIAPAFDNDVASLIGTSITNQDKSMFGITDKIDSIADDYVSSNYTAVSNVLKSYVNWKAATKKVNNIQTKINNYYNYHPYQKYFYSQGAAVNWLPAHLANYKKELKSDESVEDAARNNFKKTLHTTLYQLCGGDLIPNWSSIQDATTYIGDISNVINSISNSITTDQELANSQGSVISNIASTFNQYFSGSNIESDLIKFATNAVIGTAEFAVGAIYAGGVGLYDDIFDINNFWKTAGHNCIEIAFKFKDISSNHNNIAKFNNLYYKYYGDLSGSFPSNTIINANKTNISGYKFKGIDLSLSDLFGLTEVDLIYDQMGADISKNNLSPGISSKDFEPGNWRYSPATKKIVEWDRTGFQTVSGAIFLQVIDN